MLPSLPLVAEAGAFSADQVYHPGDIATIVQYATDRGVRVVPEIDTPGHSRALGLAPIYNEAIACRETTGDTWPLYCVEPPCGQLNPAVPAMYSLLTGVFADVRGMFADEYFHVGFDEINFACWESDSCALTQLCPYSCAVTALPICYSTAIAH